MIYQIHPVHGKHIAYTSIEAKANVENGWKTVSDTEFYKKPASDSVDDDERADLIQQYVAKFGEAPHHRSSNTTIQAKLDE